MVVPGAKACAGHWGGGDYREMATALQGPSFHLSAGSPSVDVEDSRCFPSPTQTRCLVGLSASWGHLALATGKDNPRVGVSHRAGKNIAGAGRLDPGISGKVLAWGRAPPSLLAPRKCQASVT